MNMKHADRTLDRSQIFPLQLISPEGNLIKIDFFQDWGELGIGSITWNQKNLSSWYISTGEKVYHLDIITWKKEDLLLDSISGIHEISLFENLLFITNTHFDEIICYDIDNNKIKYSKSLVPAADKIAGGYNNIYHCNLVFKDYENRLCCLVHHASGRQFTKKIADKIIKLQGDGGILFLDGGLPLNLGLRAPHSVRLISNNYWIFDSGRHNLCIYDREWLLKKVLPICGWGRGAVMTQYQHLYYAGISATRKRYCSFWKKENNENYVQEINVDPLELSRKWKINNVEQINDVNLISEEVAKLLIMKNKCGAGW